VRKKTVVVQIAGQRYTIKSDAEESYVNDLARLVDRQIVAVQEKTKSAPLHSQVVLAALNIADSFMQEEHRLKALKKQVREKTSKLLKYIDLEVAKQKIKVDQA
jgi:cell division protein ZapA (FtsZ GTPase activity inhibitor)